MSEHQNLKPLTFENLVLDSSFREWVFGISQESIVIWQNLYNEQSSSRETIEQAKQFLMEMKSQILSLPADEVEMEVQKLLKSINEEGTAIRSISGTARNRFLKIASVAAVLIISGSIIFYSLKSAASAEVISKVTKRGERATLELADGSSVIMNVDSKLEYPEVFSDNIRSVHLEGEAIFHVKRDEAKPFIVKTGDFDVQVLGTSFNVATYVNDSLATIELLSGAVMVKTNDKEHTIVALRPLEKLLYDKVNRQWKIEQLENEGVIGWKDGILTFNNTPVKDIVKELERWFDVKIILTNSNNGEHFYTGKFKSGNLEKILEGLCFTWKASYEIKNKDVVIRFQE